MFQSIKHKVNKIMVKYYTATIYKKDDILLLSEDGKNFYYHGSKRTYSDLGVNPTYSYAREQLKDVRPATLSDFDFFRICPPPEYRG